ncbi:MAG: hypothetical protein WBB82_14455 [Limnothrix sp.]
MSSHIRQVTPTKNQDSLQCLVRTIRLGEGEFSIVLVNAETVQERLAILRDLREAIAPIEIRELWLHPTVTDIYGAVEPQLFHQHPRVLSISGLNHLENLAIALQRANFSRDRFQKYCPFTMIWWIDDKVSKELRRYAPDLSSCLTTPIHIATTEIGQSTDDKKQQAKQKSLVYS